MKRKKVIIIGLITALVLLSGCGNAIPELTEDEERVIVTYAADVVAQHHDKKTTRLIDTEAETEKRLKDAERAAKAEELRLQNLMLEEEGSENGEESENREAGDNSEDPAVVDNAGGAIGGDRISSLASLVGADGIEITYDGYSLSDAYPEDGGNLAFSNQASAGKQYLILKFHALNTGDAAAVLDGIGNELKGKVTSGDINSKLIQIWSDDNLLLGKLEAAPAENVDFVLICEIDGRITEVSGLSVSMSSDLGKASFKL